MIQRSSPLIEVKREPEGMGFQIFSGLFGIDKKKVKFFYVPVRRAESPAPVVPASEPAEPGPAPPAGRE